MIQRPGLLTLCFLLYLALVASWNPAPGLNPVGEAATLVVMLLGGYGLLRLLSHQPFSYFRTVIGLMVWCILFTGTMLLLLSLFPQPEGSSLEWKPAITFTAGCMGWIMIGASTYLWQQHIVPPEQRTTHCPPLFTLIDNHFFDLYIAKLYGLPTTVIPSMEDVTSSSLTNGASSDSEVILLKDLPLDTLEDKTNENIALLDYYTEYFQQHQDISRRVIKQAYLTLIPCCQEIAMVESYINLFMVCYPFLPPIQVQVHALESGDIHFGILSRLCYNAMKSYERSTPNQPLRITITIEQRLEIAITFAKDAAAFTSVDVSLKELLNYYYYHQYQLTERNDHANHYQCRLFLPLRASL